MSYRGIPRFQQQELTSVRRARESAEAKAVDARTGKRLRESAEGGPGSGPRPGQGGRGTPQAAGKSSATPSSVFKKSFPSAAKAIDAMAQDNGFPEGFHRTFGPETTRLAKVAEPAFSKMSNEELDIVASGDQDEAKQILKKFGRSGRAADKLLSVAFDELSPSRKGLP